MSLINRTNNIKNKEISLNKDKYSVLGVIKNNKVLIKNDYIFENNIPINKLNVEEELKKENCIFDLDSPNFDIEKFFMVYYIFMDLNFLYSTSNYYVFTKKNLILENEFNNGLVFNNINYKNLYYSGIYTLEFDVTITDESVYNNYFIFKCEFPIYRKNKIFFVNTKIERGKTNYKIELPIYQYKSVKSSYSYLNNNYKIYFYNKDKFKDKIKFTNVKLYYGYYYNEKIIENINKFNNFWNYIYSIINRANNSKYVFFNSICNKVNYNKQIDLHITKNEKLINCIDKFNNKIFSREVYFQELFDRKSRTQFHKYVKEIINSYNPNRKNNNLLEYNNKDVQINDKTILYETIENFKSKNKYIYIYSIYFENGNNLIYFNLIATINIQNIVDLQFYFLVDNLEYKNYFSITLDTNNVDIKINKQRINQNEILYSFVLRAKADYYKHPVNNGLYVKLEKNEQVELVNKHLINNEWLRLF